MTRTWEQWARSLDMPVDRLTDAWSVLRSKLIEHRQRRVAPLKDDKILTDWNGLMMAAMAMGARILENPAYVAAARKAAGFIRAHLVDEAGGLLHRYRDGQAVITGNAGDYACMIMGLIELYRTTYDTDLLEWAVALQAKMDTGFWDQDGGGYFFTTDGETQLPVRPKELHDGALPSSNSVALSNLILLSRLTGKSQWEERAHQLAQAFAPLAGRQPAAFTHFFNGLDLVLSSGQEMV